MEPVSSQTLGSVLLLSAGDNLELWSDVSAQSIRVSTRWLTPQVSMVFLGVLRWGAKTDCRWCVLEGGG